MTRAGLKLYEEGLQAIVDDALESGGVASLLRGAGLAYRANGQLDEAERYCRQALAMAERVGAVEAQADALVAVAVLPQQTREAAMGLLQQALELAEPAGLLRIASMVHYNMAAILLSVDPQAARAHALLAAERSRQRGSVIGQLVDLSLATWVLLLQGDFGSAEETLPELHKLRDAIDYYTGRIPFFDLLEGQYFRYRGELPEAIRRLRRSHTDARQRGNLTDTGWFGLFLAEALLETDQWDDAEQVLLQTLEVGEQLQMSSLRVAALAFLSAVHATRQDVEDARHVLTEARANLSPRSGDRDEVYLSWAEARLAAAERRWPQALAAIEDAAKSWARLGMRWYHAQTLQEWAKMHLARGDGSGDVERAQTLFEEALALFEEMDVPFYVTQVRERLEALGVAPDDILAVAHNTK